MSKKVILYVLAGSAAFISAIWAIKKLQEIKRLEKQRDAARGLAFRRTAPSDDYYGEYTL